METDAAGEPGAARVRVETAPEHTYGYVRLGLRRCSHTPRFPGRSPLDQVSNPYAESAYGRKG
ncbi:hypothetical protein GCM10010498_21490 [Streptomyces cavourensis]|nr:hypothetical protein GCM10010498_21490 [Streptomyces cavourensis]